MIERNKCIGRVLDMVDGCDNRRLHPDMSPHGMCVTSRYKVRVVEADDDGVHFWARPAG